MFPFEAKSSLYLICNLLQVGGLGDVVTSLSRAIQDLNHHVDIVLPKYDCLNLSHVSHNFLAFHFEVIFTFRRLKFTFLAAECNLGTTYMNIVSLVSFMDWNR